MKRRSTSWRWLLLTMLAFGVVGCGLGRYEDEMDKQRKRVTAFDELNRALDNPIDMPTWQAVSSKGDKSDVPAWTYDVFLRLPKVYGSVAKDKSVPSKNFPLARYSSGDPRTNTNAFVVAAYVQEAKKSDEPAKLTYSPEGFRTQLRVALSLFCSRTHQTDVPERSRLTPYTVEVFSPYPDANSIIRYDFYQHANIGVGRVTVPYTFDVYIREESGKQVAIVFQRDAKLQDAESFNNAVKASLGTLDISAEAAGKRGAFKRR